MPNSLPLLDPKKSLRQAIRRKRRALTKRQQKNTGHALAKLLKTLPRYQTARRIAFYLPNDGEADPHELIEYSMKCGKTCYLPVIDPLKSNHLHFVRYLPSMALVKNQFGILEPQLSSRYITPLWTFDILFMPLVAFDRTGTRLGMGGGYYDRTLANQADPQKPLLVGLAHSCQEVDSLAASVWDVPMGVIATEKELIITEQTANSGHKPA